MALKDYVNVAHDTCNVAPGAQGVDSSEQCGSVGWCVSTAVLQRCHYLVCTTLHDHFA